MLPKRSRATMPICEGSPTSTVVVLREMTPGVLTRSGLVVVYGWWIVRYEAGPGVIVWLWTAGRKTLLPANMAWAVSVVVVAPVSQKYRLTVLMPEPPGRLAS